MVLDVQKGSSNPCTPPSGYKRQGTKYESERGEAHEAHPTLIRTARVASSMYDPNH